MLWGFYVACVWQNWMCESPTYMPLNQIGKADKRYLHRSVAGLDYYQWNFPPYALMESWDIS